MSQLTTGGGKPGEGYPAVFVKGKRAQSVEDDESWRADEVTPTLNAFDVGDTRATTLVGQSLPTQLVGTDDNDAQGGFMVLGGQHADDPLLPPGLDSHRYRTIGNGVVAPVAEWIGRRLAAYLRGELT